MAKTTGQGATTSWLEKNRSQLEDEFPQISSFDFESLRSRKTHNLTLDEFKDILTKVDKSFHPPPPTAQNANQVGWTENSTPTNTPSCRSIGWKIIVHYVYQWVSIFDFGSYVLLLFEGIDFIEFVLVFLYTVLNDCFRSD